MDVHAVKIELIQWLAELQDTAVLRQLQGLKKQQESPLELDAELSQELERRLERYESGETRFSSWDEVKDRVRNSAESNL
jgi:putative addiction module component (TIGR02574 family)